MKLWFAPFCSNVSSCSLFLPSTGLIHIFGIIASVSVEAKIFCHVGQSLLEFRKALCCIPSVSINFSEFWHLNFQCSEVIWSHFSRKEKFSLYLAKHPMKFGWSAPIWNFILLSLWENCFGKGSFFVACTALHSFRTISMTKHFFTSRVFFWNLWKNTNYWTSSHFRGLWIQTWGIMFLQRGDQRVHSVAVLITKRFVKQTIT